MSYILLLLLLLFLFPAPTLSNFPSPHIIPLSCRTSATSSHISSANLLPSPSSSLSFSTFLLHLMPSSSVNVQKALTPRLGPALSRGEDSISPGRATLVWEVSRPKGGAGIFILVIASTVASNLTHRLMGRTGSV